MSEETEETNAEVSTGLGSNPAAEVENTTTDDGGYSKLIDSLPDNLKNNDTIKNSKSFESLADQLVNAQSALGTKRIQEPQADWGEEEWNSFYDKTRPADGEYSIPDEISIEGVEKVPELPEESQQELVDFAGKLGLNQHQFDALYQRYIELGVEGESVGKQQTENAVKENRQAIQMEWGDQYDTNLALANQAFEATSQQIPEIKALIENDPVIANHPGVLKLFHTLAEASGDALPVAGNNPASGFANNNVHGVKQAIQELDADYSSLIMSDPSSLNMKDRTKRQEILQKRTNLYSKLYGE